MNLQLDIKMSFSVNILLCYKLSLPSNIKTSLQNSVARDDVPRVETFPVVPFVKLLGPINFEGEQPFVLNLYSFLKVVTSSIY